MCLLSVLPGVMHIRIPQAPVYSELEFGVQDIFYPLLGLERHDGLRH